MFVPNTYFCRELRFVAILRSNLRFLLRNTGLRLYSEFLRKNLAAGGSAVDDIGRFDHFYHWQEVETLCNSMNPGSDTLSLTTLRRIRFVAGTNTGPCIELHESEMLFLRNLTFIQKKILPHLTSLTIKLLTSHIVGRKHIKVQLCGDYWRSNTAAAMSKYCLIAARRGIPSSSLTTQ